MIRLPASTALGVLLIAAAAHAQCALFGITTQSYGNGCGVFPNPGATVPSLTVGFDAAACAFDVSITTSGVCCNVFPVERFLIVGAAPAALPAPTPFFPAGCTVLAQPDAVVALPGPIGMPVQVGVPGWMPPGLTFYLQGGTTFFTTIGFSLDGELTNGVAVTTF